MHPKRFALISGIIFLALGIMSLISTFNNESSVLLREIKLTQSYHIFADLFALNILNKILFIAFGFAGIGAAHAPTTTLPASIRYARWLFYVMGLFAVLGLLNETDTLFGYMPLFGNLIWLHTVAALFGAYYGFLLTSRIHYEEGSKVFVERHLNDYI